MRVLSRDMKREAALLDYSKDLDAPIPSSSDLAKVDVLRKYARKVERLEIELASREHEAQKYLNRIGRLEESIRHLLDEKYKDQHDLFSE